MSRPRCLVAGLVLLIGCVEVEPGLTVDLTLAWAPRPASEVVTNDLGLEFEVDAGGLSLADLELVTCPDELGAVVAHTVATPLSSGAPRAEVWDDDAVRHDAIHPPVGRYCAVRVVIAPPDADADGLDGVPALVDRTLVVTGRWREPGGDWQPLALSTAARWDVELPVDPIDLDADRRDVELRIVRDPARAFDGIDPRTASPSQAANDVLVNLVGQATIEIVP